MFHWNESFGAIHKDISNLVPKSVTMLEMRANKLYTKTQNTDNDIKCGQKSVKQLVSEWEDVISL